MVSTKASLKEFKDKSLYYRSLKEWKPDCERCLVRPAVVLLQCIEYHRLYCSDCLSRYLDAVGNRSVQQSYIIPNTLVRDLDPQFREEISYWWGRRVPAFLRSFVFDDRDRPVEGESYKNWTTRKGGDMHNSF